MIYNKNIYHFKRREKIEINKNFSQNLNIADVIEVINSCQEIWKDSITLLDHISIIQKYTKNEYLDRKQAIDVYKKFNIENPEYLLLVININRSFYPDYDLYIEQLPNELIVFNLYVQLLYFCFKTTITYFGKFQFAKKFMNF
ncbi:hypothetical protein IJJ97_06875 [bacterium]|nr:hypothetical protein [bacterium]